MKIAIVGAESTGKSVLATALADALADATGWRVTAVPEWLRLWCEREGRTPRPEEQAAIATETHARIDAAAALHDIVVCDTTALMTTVYSDLLFNDRSLDALAIAHQRSMDLTLLTALDLPWVADGHQRDGPHVRGPVDDHVRALLIDHGLPWALVAVALANLAFESGMVFYNAMLADLAPPERIGRWSGWGCTVPSPGPGMTNCW